MRSDADAPTSPLRSVVRLIRQIVAHLRAITSPARSRTRMKELPDRYE
jgi:hypothetical protein